MSTRWILALLATAGLTLLGAAVAVGVVGRSELGRSTSRLADVPRPRIEVGDEARATVGEPTPVDVTAVDTFGTELAVSVVDDPPGRLVRSSAGFEWTPAGPGSWSVTLAARDAFGRSTTTSVPLVARHRPHPDLLVAMGDSVASGHGLQRRDYLTGDRCWRDEADAYPVRALQQLHPDGAVALVACSGAGADDLLDEAVSGGPNAVGDRHVERSQLEWAVRANPASITVTVGANDLEFHRPEGLIADGSLDRVAVAERLDSMEGDLGRVLGRLVDATDARIYVTTYHNPVADEPRGIEGCRGRCFHDAASEAVTTLNTRLAGVVDGLGDPRVVLVDVAPVFEGHGATRPIGGFALRELGLGVAARFVPVPTVPTSAFCAQGDGRGRGSWISEVDCIHPTGTGSQAYADAVVAAAEAG